MTESALPDSEPIVDDEGRVCAAHCRHCGYNLRSLLADDGVCPECGQPVALSLRGDRLQFSSPDWVRKLARGVLLIVIAIGALIGFYVLTIAVSMMLALWSLGGTPSPPSLMALTAISSVCIVGIVVLAVVGLVYFTVREPETRDRPEGLTARRLIRVGLWLLPVPIIIGVIQMASLMYSPGLTGPMVLGRGFWTLSAISAVVALLAYVFVPLATLRRIVQLMRRIPRPGLVVFAQIEFWGLLVTGTLAVLAYTWMIVGLVVIPTTRATSAFASAATMPTTMSSVVTAQPQAGSPVTYYSYSSTSTAPGATSSQPWATTTMAAMPPGMPTTGVGLMIAFMLSGFGFCAMIGFVIAGVVLLVLVRRALVHAAREAAGNVATLSPIAE